MTKAVSRRGFLAATGAVAIGATLTACTPRSTATSKASATIRSTWWGGDVRTAKFNKIYDAFTSSHPNTTIVRQPVADFNTYFEKLPVQFTGGNAPDIVHFTERQVADYASKHQLVDLRELDGVLDLSHFSKQALTAGTYKGKLVMLLIGATIPATIYNKTLFDKAGVAPPTKDWTWDTLVAASTQLKKALPAGTVGLTYQAVAAPIFDTILHQDGNSLFAPDFSAELNFSAQDATKWFQMWKDLSDEGLCQTAEQASQETTAPFEDTMFAKGKAVMNVQNSNQLVTYQTALGSTYELDLATFPQVGKKPVALVLGSYASINASSKFAKNAGQVQDFFVNNAEANKIFGLELGTPGNSNWASAVKDSLGAPDAKVLAFGQQMSDISASAQIRPSGGAQAETLMTQIALAVGFGKQTPAKAGAAFVDQLAAAIKAGA